MRPLAIMTILLAGVAAAAAQAPAGNWQQPGEIQRPGEIQQPKGSWAAPGAIQKPAAAQRPSGASVKPVEIQKAGEIQTPGEMQKPTGPWLTPREIQKPGEIQQPKGVWVKPGEIQTPGEIQQPKAVWIKPGEIQVPRGIEAVKAVANGCENRLSVLADALFDFDKSKLRPDAEATLGAALPEIAKATGHAARIEGHTDGKGSDAYNMKLSEARGRTVRDWLGVHGAIPMSTPIKAFGKRVPVAPNTTADGRDDPEGRQKNRRVEIVFETCKT